MIVAQGSEAGGHLPACQRAAAVHDLDELGIWVAVEEVDHRRAVRRNLEALAVEQRHDEVDAEGSGVRAQPVDVVRELSRGQNTAG